MNKFSVFTGLLVVLAAVVYVEAGAGSRHSSELQNEIQDTSEIDDELEGGFFKTNAAKPVGLNSNDEWGWDVLDKNKGIKGLNAKRMPECKHAKRKEACETCCAGLDKAANFKILNVLSSTGGCTCYSRENAYSTKLA